jgi:predicted transcriptional regulator of viral defense system
MTSAIENKLRELTSDYVTSSELSVLLVLPDNARHAQIKRALAQGYLKRLTRGVYHKAGYLEKRKPHPFEMSQYLLWPSYVSLESALSYRGLIPEAIYKTTCVTSKRPKIIENEYGLFEFKKIPNKNFMVGVERIEEDGYVYFVATAWKALCDYVYCYKKNWTTVDPLVMSMRIEKNDLPTLDQAEYIKLTGYYKCKRIDNFLKGVLSER